MPACLNASLIFGVAAQRNEIRCELKWAGDLTHFGSWAGTVIAIAERLPERHGGGAHQADHVGGKLTSARGISFPAYLEDGIVASRSTPSTAVTQELDFVSTVRGRAGSDGYEILGIRPALMLCNGIGGCDAAAGSISFICDRNDYGQGRRIGNHPFVRLHAR